MSRFFVVTVTDNGAAWTPPDGALWTVRFGAPQMPAGWYDTIADTGGGTHAAVVVDGSTITVEIAEQALSTPGNNVLTVIAYTADGYQLAAWPFALNVQAVPGLEAPAVTEYYNLLTAQVAQALTNAQAAAGSATAAAASATLSESWAVGGTGTREGEDTNNAEYWAEQAEAAAGSAVSSFNGRTGAVMPQSGDYTAAMVGAPPSGSIVAFAGGSAPNGWLICDGSSVSRTTYASLFSVIGTTYGSGDNSTTFNLPNLNGHVLAGAGTQPVGTTAGADTKQIARANLPNDRLQIIDNGAFIVDSVQTGTESGPMLTLGTRQNSRYIVTDPLGSGQAFDVRQATLYINYIIKV